MSALTDVPVISPAERSARATQRLCDALGLGVLKPKDVKNLATALAEATAEEVVTNATFRQRVLGIFQELSVSSKPATKKPAPPKAAKPKLVPIRDFDPKLFAPDKPIDPYLVQYAYGDEQLRLMLQQFSVATLKKSAEIVEERNPGTKPVNRAQKVALLDYIVSHVTATAQAR